MTLSLPPLLYSNSVLLAVVTRKVIHYGYVFDYLANNILREYEGGAGVLEGLLVEEQTSWSFVTDKIRSSHLDVNQSTVNSYLPGQVRRRVRSRDLGARSQFFRTQRSCCEVHHHF